MQQGGCYMVSSSNTTPRIIELLRLLNSGANRRGCLQPSVLRPKHQWGWTQVLSRHSWMDTHMASHPMLTWVENGAFTSTLVNSLTHTPHTHLYIHLYARNKTWISPAAGLRHKVYPVAGPWIPYSSQLPALGPMTSPYFLSCSPLMHLLVNPS